MIRRFFKHLWESIKSLKRNGWMTIVAMSMVSITLTLAGIFAAVLLNTERVATQIENNIRITTFLAVDSTDAKETVVEQATGATIANPDYQKVYKQIEALPNVTKITYSSKEEQLENLKAAMGDAWDIDFNPLSDVYYVEVSSTDVVKSVTEQIKAISGIDSAEYGGTSSDKIFSLVDNVRLWGFVGTGLLVLVAVFLISNTIRITIMSRRRDIEIMRLVGAKNSYIRGPFFMEGAWVGFLGALMPAALVGFLYHLAYGEVNASLLQDNLSLYPEQTFILYLVLAIIGIGMVIGAMGATLSMRRYLKF